MTTASTRPADPIGASLRNGENHARWPYARRFRRVEQRRTPGSLPRPAADTSTTAHHQTPAGTGTAKPDEALERRAGRDVRGPGRVRGMVRGAARKPA